MKEDWIECTLGEVCEVNMGQSPPSSTYNTDGIGLPFFQGKAEFTDLHPVVKKWCSIPKKIANKNDILLSVRAPVGSTNIADQECSIGRGLAAITYKYGNMFIWYYLKSIEPKLDSQGTGTTFKAISGTILKSQIIEFPPLVEQKSIVKKIEELFSSLDSGIADLKKAQDQLVIYRQAVLKKAFEGELTKEWRAKQTNLPSADELLEQIKEERQKHYDQQLANWKEAVKTWEKNQELGKKPKKPKKLIDYPKIEQSSTLPILNLGELVFQISNKMMPEEAPEFPFIGMDCLEKNALKPHFTYKFKEFKSAGNWFNTNHVLYGRLRPYLNKVYQAEYEGVASGEFIILKTIKAFNPNYLKLILHQQDFVHWSNNQSAGDKPRVKFDQIALYPIKVPTIKEQHQIIQEIESRLSVCDTVEKDITDSLEKAQALRQSILKKAFEGKLLSEEEIAKCKTDVTYEPASVLLERIKAEKNKK